MTTDIPLSLYVHIPWCVQKCPYCDFNSHTQKGVIPERRYIEALLDDLRQDLARFPELKKRQLESIFIGGGTPSLISPAQISHLLKGIKAELTFKESIEISMEANPGTVEANNFIEFRRAGITRISIGIQSFDDDKLERLGRIHNAEEAKWAAKLARQAEFSSFNLDLMHGLPNQTQQEALNDLKQAIAINPPHLSWYQLTIEPNTPYYSKPPILPNDDALWDIFEQGQQLLMQAGYVQYEISAYSKKGFQCQHNLNYWRFGDYLGIGCGAHGKVTCKDRSVFRTIKVKHPRGYLESNTPYIFELARVNINELAFEFFMNRFRLRELCLKTDFTAFTHLSLGSIETSIQDAIGKGFLFETDNYWQVTEKGYLFLNDLVALFIFE